MKRGSRRPRPRQPRLPDGHPDLNGRWVGAGGDGGYTVFKDNDGIIHADRVERTFSTSNADQEKNGASYHYYDQLRYDERLANDPNKPPYKSEFLAKVKDLDIHENQIDPHILCHPDGPREGPPGRIVQANGTVIFLYANGENGDFWRIIPTDGRPHRTDLDDSYFGDSIGRWDGDTLVVDTTGFNEDTWLGSAGWFHSTALHEVERVTRKGNILTYQATFEDPKVWTISVKPTSTLMLNSDPEGEIAETAPCENRDIGHLVNHDHF